jgi:uncharacterized short protein YbdD (DUF466 family)
MNHKCPECETPYIPYNREIACPKCGDKPEMEDYPEFINGICESFLYNLGQGGCFHPMCWVTMDVSDSLQMFMFGVFDKWMEEMKDHEPQERTKAFEEFYNEIMEKVDLDGADFMFDYIKELGLTVYNEFFNIREIDPTNLRGKNDESGKEKS